jgi:hypothetical protein
MSNARTAGQQLQTQVMEAVRMGQEAVVGALKTCADAVQSITPQLPGLSSAVASKLPNPADLVTSAYDVAEKLLASQRKFAADVLAVTGSVTGSKNRASQN